MSSFSPLNTQNLRLAATTDHFRGGYFLQRSLHTGACLLSPQECLALWHHIHISRLTDLYADPRPSLCLSSPFIPSLLPAPDLHSPPPFHRYRSLNGTVRRLSPVGSPLCAPAAACSSRRSDTRAGPCRASVSCRRVRTETSRTGRGLGWTWWLLARRTARFQHPTGTAAHMGVRCSPKTPSGKQPLSRLSCTLQVGLPSSLL